MPAIPLAGWALGVAAVGTGYSIYAGERGAAQAKKAMKAEQARNDLSAARERRDAIRSARAAYASSQQSAENQGVALSSSSQGGLGSISSQLETNLSFLDQYKVFSDQASSALQKAATWKQRASVAGDIASAGMSVASNATAIKNTFNSIFKK